MRHIRLRGTTSSLRCIVQEFFVFWNAEFLMVALGRVRRCPSKQKYHRITMQNALSDSVVFKEAGKLI